MTEQQQDKTVTEQLLAGVLVGTGPGRWQRYVRVDYVQAGETWRAAQDDERCKGGAGGRSGRKACGRPAYVTEVSERRPGVPYRSGFCRDHAEGRLVLEDGTVVEPTTGLLWGS
jgi:hypothetical protein